MMMSMKKEQEVLRSIWAALPAVRAAAQVPAHLAAQAVRPAVQVPAHPAAVRAVQPAAHLAALAAQVPAHLAAQSLSLAVPALREHMQGRHRIVIR